MNRYTLITFIALAVLVIAVPVYGLLEPQRMESAQVELRQEFVSDAAVMYIENCAVCHGAQGEGIGATPPLNTEGLRQADYDFLYKTIARGRYDTAMTGWHSDEGGIYNDYQIDELVSLIRYVDWTTVGELSAQRGLIPPPCLCLMWTKIFWNRWLRWGQKALSGLRGYSFTPTTAPHVTA